jgi:hypothetical protein
VGRFCHILPYRKEVLPVLEHVHMVVLDGQALEPHTTPLFVSAVRLLPAGGLLVAWAASQNRKQPSGGMAWLAIALFALADATCFQV